MTRILTAAVLLSILIASIVFAPLEPLFVAFALTVMVLALYEFWVLAGARGAKPDAALGYVAGAAMTVAFYFNVLEWLVLIIPALTIAALALEMLRGAPFDKMIASAGATVLGVLYVVLLGGHLLAVRTMPNELLAADLLSYFFLVMVSSDSGAYYAGRAFGRHKLAPTISPGKTWEGAVGGMLASLAAAALAHYWFFPELRLTAALPLAAVMNVLGVVGDLTESALKRGAGAKDAANILPGHGGFLDRLDSLLFNAPVIYYFARLYWG